jgi:hypothetical protein
MADIWIGKYCINNNIDIMVLKHENEYVKYVPQKITIFDVESKNDEVQTKIVNSIFIKNYDEPNYKDYYEKTIKVNIERKLELRKKELNYEKINSIFNSHDTTTRVTPKTQEQQSGLKLNSTFNHKMFLKNKKR